MPIHRDRDGLVAKSKHWRTPTPPGPLGRYWKAVYRLYDHTFSRMVEVPPYHGTVGPTLWGEVGDNITVVFRVGWVFGFLNASGASQVSRVEVRACCSGWG